MDLLMFKRLLCHWLIFAILSTIYLAYLTIGLVNNAYLLYTYEPPNQIETIKLDKINNLENRLADLENIFSQLETYEITAYCETGNKTATGTIPKAGRTIAVDPKVIPYGTKVWIEGIGFRVAEDCGGLVKGKIIDLFVEENALKFGRQKRKVVVL